jgi:hypothetical protein
MRKLPMKDKELGEIIEELADEAKSAGYNDLAVVLYTFLGAKEARMSKSFTKYCQRFARRAVNKIKLDQNKKNN